MRYAEQVHPPTLSQEHPILRLWRRAVWRRHRAVETLLGGDGFNHLPYVTRQALTSP